MMHHTSNMILAWRRRWLLALLPVLVVAVGIVLANELWPSSKGEALGVPTRWPPFTMVYREDLAEDDGSSEYLLRSFTFNDARDWRLELKESSSHPEQVGAYQSFQSDTYTHYDPTTNTLETEKVPPPDLVGPNDWLFPGKMEAQAKSSQWKELDIDSTEVRSFTNTMSASCQIQITDDTPGPPPMFRPCVGRASYEIVTQVDYDKDLGIPVAVTDYVNGRVTRTIRVLELSIAP